MPFNFLDDTNDEGNIMDLNTLDVVKLANEGTVLELLHPGTNEVLTDEGEKVADKDNIKPFFVRILGHDSDTFREQSVINERNRRSQKGKNKATDEKARNIELLAGCTTECYMIEDGKPIVFSRAEMVRLYTKYPWMSEQATSRVTDRSVLMAK